MLELEIRKSFKHDWKKFKTNDLIKLRLDTAVNILLSGEQLPSSFHMHKLTGNWRGFVECHIRPDLLLIFKIENDTLTLYQIGNHAELFE